MDEMYGIHSTREYASNKLLMSSPDSIIVPSDYHALFCSLSQVPMFGSDELLFAASAISEAISITLEIQPEEDMSLVDLQIALDLRQTLAIHGSPSTASSFEFTHTGRLELTISNIDLWNQKPRSFQGWVLPLHQRCVAARAPATRRQQYLNDAHQKYAQEHGSNKDSWPEWDPLIWKKVVGPPKKGQMRGIYITGFSRAWHPLAMQYSMNATQPQTGYPSSAPPQIANPSFGGFRPDHLPPPT
ncbi:hypothetical protein SLEP1_g42804 [Rubroshorea leprosula]|uniref:Uncharacterized protein n=1 Tax=Rubroshorea leprosula TaxID=152421 RepID=A0AAV5LAZ2_9ROSI|nr:hypothetical protein SLEP1_g42804 [Rubroshorea leprosula]